MSTVETTKPVTLFILYGEEEGGPIVPVDFVSRDAADAYQRGLEDAWGLVPIEAFRSYAEARDAKAAWEAMRPASSK